MKAAPSSVPTKAPATGPATRPLTPGRKRVTSAATAWPPRHPAPPIASRFAPNAVTPPSWNRSACTASTTAITTSPREGPTIAAASIPPTRCPLVPGTSGTFTSCAAKTNAESAPSVPAGTRSGRDFSARSAQPSVPAPAAQVPAATPAPRKPSGMCIRADSLPGGTPARSGPGMPYHSSAWGKHRP